MSQKPLIVAACASNGLSLDQAAYVLATAEWETAHTLEPITEMGSAAYLRAKPYYPFIGRGFVQLTWKANYIKAGQLTGADLVNHPELALDPQIAVKVLVVGMKQGWFTGKKLSDYISGGKRDFVSARRIVNGTDHATEIAILARKYQTELAAEGYGGAKPVAATIQPAPIPATRRVVRAALLDSGSRTITAADSVNKAIAVGGTGLTGLTILSQLTDALKSVPAWGYLLGGIIVLAVIFYFNRKIMLARIEDAISGANTGRYIGLVRQPASPTEPEAVADEQSPAEQQTPASEAPVAETAVNVTVVPSAGSDAVAAPIVDAGAV